jgi:hypothetical protein
MSENEEKKEEGKILKFTQQRMPESAPEENQKKYVGGESKCNCEKEECPLKKLDIKDSKGKPVPLKDMIEMLVMNNNACLAELNEQKMIMNKVLQVMEMVMADLGIDIDEKTGKIVKKSVIRMPGSKIIS